MTTIKEIDVNDQASRLRAAQADAKRWQWLRYHMSHQQCGPNVGWTLDRLLPGDDPDSAVDAAMSAERSDKC